MSALVSIKGDYLFQLFWNYSIFKMVIIYAILHLKVVNKPQKSPNNNKWLIDPSAENCLLEKSVESCHKSRSRKCCFLTFVEDFAVESHCWICSSCSSGSWIFNLMCDWTRLLMIILLKSGGFGFSTVELTMNLKSFWPVRSSDIDSR